MNSYITGAVIKRMREDKNLTQLALAEKLGVSDKTVSKWETGKGYPDITLVEEIAEVLGVSVSELFSGSEVTNKNRSSNMKRCKIYVCPVCGNVIVSTGEAVISCCGITLNFQEAEEADGEHMINVETVEDEYYVTLAHNMTKEHYISFIAAASDNGISVTKLYPEQSAEARFKINRTQMIYAYCNKHGLFKIRIRRFRQ